MSDEAVFAAARAGDVESLSAALEATPERLHAREEPYGWSLLHAAAHAGQAEVVNVLLARGLDANTKEQGDNTTAMHWAAATGSAAIVRRLADAGCDVIGHGDDHALEVIGWATCWDGCDDDAHREVVRVLIERGARHHIFSAIATNDAGEVRRIVESNHDALRQTLSRNEHFELPLLFAVRKNLNAMVALLLELGADPTATDSAGVGAAGYSAWKRVDARIIRRLYDAGVVTPYTAIALGDFATAERLHSSDPTAMHAEGTLHMLAKRGSVDGVRWVLDHGVDPNSIWGHWDSRVTALHMAVLEDHPDVVRLLLERGADPTIKDTLHDSDAIGWAVYFERESMAVLLRESAGANPS